MKSFLLIVVLFFCVFNHVHPQSSWKLEKNSHGIKVYTRMTDESVIKEFKAITIIEADRKAIEHVITEVDKYVNWYPDVSESSVLEDVNSKEKIGYYKIDVPWPASDRDAVLKLNVKYSDEKNRL